MFDINGLVFGAYFFRTIITNNWGQIKHSETHKSTHIRFETGKIAHFSTDFFLTQKQAIL